MHSQINTFAPTGKRTYSVDEIKSILGISKRKAYDLCKTNCFKVVQPSAYPKPLSIAGWKALSLSEDNKHGINRQKRKIIRCRLL